MAINFLNESALWPGLITTIIPIVVGSAAAHFKIFIEPQSEFRKRINLTRQTLIEQTAAKHAALLLRLKAITDDDVLRGDGREEPDLVGELTSEVFRVSTIFNRLEALKFLVRMAYWLLALTVMFGIFGLVVVCAFAKSPQYIIILGIVLIFIQVITVIGIMIAANKLETYEDVA